MTILNLTNRVLDGQGEEVTEAGSPVQLGPDLFLVRHQYQWKNHYSKNYIPLCKLGREQHQLCIFEIQLKLSPLSF